LFVALFCPSNYGTSDGLTCCNNLYMYSPAAYLRGKDVSIHFYLSAIGDYRSVKPALKIPGSCRNAQCLVCIVSATCDLGFWWDFVLGAVGIFSNLRSFK
jgi:hypothetical protein